METIRLEFSPKADNKTGKWAVLEPKGCMGCGVCVHKCPTHSLELVHRLKEQDFPGDVPELNARRVKERGKKLLDQNL